MTPDILRVVLVQRGTNRVGFQRKKGGNHPCSRKEALPSIPTKAGTLQGTSSALDYANHLRKEKEHHQLSEQERNPLIAGNSIQPVVKGGGGRQ